jgi:hypothetical protein
MGQDTTAKLADVVKAKATESERETLVAMGTLSSHSTIVYSKHETWGLKKLAEAPAEGRFFMGTVYVHLFGLEWPVSIVRTSKGNVIADAGIYRGKDRDAFTPPFSNIAQRGAFASALRALPDYLRADGSI